MNARKREPLTDFSRIDRRYDLIVTKKNKTASFQKEAMRTQVALYFFYEVKFV